MTILQPFVSLITYLSQLFNGNYGLGIIATIILVKLALIPLVIKQAKQSNKMKLLQPEIMKIRSKYSIEKGIEKYLLGQSKIRELYTKHNISTSLQIVIWLVQAPILMALYYAITLTPEIASHMFLWFKLNAPDPYMILPVIAAGTTYLSMKLSITDINEQIKTMMIFMPIIVFVINIKLSTIITLYVSVQNSFSIIQTYLINKFVVRNN